MTKWEDKKKRLRNSLFKYNKESLIDWSIQALKHFEIHQDFKNGHYIPHELLGLIRCILKHHLAPESKILYRRRQEKAYSPQNEFHKILNHYKDLHESIQTHLKIGDDFSSSNKLLRFLQTISHEQFWWQESFNSFDFYRIYYLFNKSPVKELFENTFELSVEDYIKCSIIFHAYHYKGENYYFNTQLIKKQFPELNIQQYLDLFSSNYQNPEDIYNKIVEPQYFDNPIYYYLEKTPFTRFPFINYGGTYQLVSFCVLKEAILYYPYFLLKKLYTQKFTDPFTKIFESYIGKLLSEYEIAHLNEKQISKELVHPEENIQNSPKIDYLIEINNYSSLLIESKGMTLHPHAQVIQAPKTYGNSIKDSIANGFSQLQEIASRLQTKPHHQNKSLHGAIITYQDFYPGPMSVVYENILKPQKLLPEVFNDIESLALPPTAINSFGIKTFEQLILAMNYDLNQINDFLITSAEINKNGVFPEGYFSLSTRINNLKFAERKLFSPIEELYNEIEESLTKYKSNV